MSLIPWILILNGTSSSGKTSVAREYRAKFNNEAKLLQIDSEVIPVFIEELGKLGLQYVNNTNFLEWFETIPKEIRSQVHAKEDELFKEACRRMIEKAKNFNIACLNVIIDTVTAGGPACPA